MRAESAMVSQSWRWSSGLRERGKKEKQGSGRESGANGTWTATDPRKAGLRGARDQGEKLEARATGRKRGQRVGVSTAASPSSMAPPSPTAALTVYSGLWLIFLYGKHVG